MLVLHIKNCLYDKYTLKKYIYTWQVGVWTSRYIIYITEKGGGRERINLVHRRVKKRMRIMSVRSD